MVISYLSPGTVGHSISTALHKAYSRWANRQNKIKQIFRPKKKNVVFPISQLTVKKMRRLIFFALEEKKKFHDRPQTVPVFIYVCYIICPYQFSDIIGLHRSFIYHQYGCTLTSQNQHISAVYFEACSHILA